jgi:hypothetical protein
MNAHRYVPSRHTEQEFAHPNQLVKSRYQRRDDLEDKHLVRSDLRQV